MYTRYTFGGCGWVEVKVHILVKGILATGEKEQVDGPREKPFTEEANVLNADHFYDIRKRGKGYYEDGRWVWDKEYFWFNKEVLNDGMQEC